MAPASSASATNPDKLKKHSSRASSTSKPEIESPISEQSGSEPAYLKELQKSLRNAVKKLNATAKVDAILAENKGKSLDELVEAKKINNDQKAQALKKPALQASIAQIEEQIGHYKQISIQYEERLVSQKAALEQAHQEELEAVRANAIADATETTAKILRQQLLTVSKFLCAAANSRRDGDAESLESRSFEGVLYQVYGGNQDAVSSMVKLIDGVDEKVQGVEGDLLDMTYGDVQQASNKFAPAETVQAATEAASASAPVSDPTLVNAGLTELQDTSVSATQETTPTSDQVAPPTQTLVSEAGNAVAESSYNPGSMTSSATTDGWVNVPRDPAETDTGLQATPANTENVDAKGQSQSGGRNRNRGGRREGNGNGSGSGSRGGRGRGDFRGRGRGGRGGRGRGGANGPSAATPGEQ